MFALVDCNNFYCSCERLFNPGLNKRPVVVLSNNDGCVIARSDEAKAIGINMAVPEYLVRDKIKEHHVAVFSSNYTLYGDMSDRVMKMLASFVPNMELYSIDEAFLDMGELAYTDLRQLGTTIQTTITQGTGIPVTIGIAPTKTLAKMANRYARKKQMTAGVHWLANKELVFEVLAFTGIGDVWGIGHQYTTLLARQGINDALAFTRLPEDWVREKMSVTGLRMLKELKGIPCMEWDPGYKRKKNICTSRSFGKLTGEKDILAEAISNHAAACAWKLRKDRSCSSKINVFINTNPFRTQDRQHAGNISFQTNVPTNDSRDIIKYALKGLDMIFRPGHQFMKCGVIVSDIVPETEVQGGLFEVADRKRNDTVMKTLDGINQSLGKETVRFAIQGFEKRYRLRQNYLSKRYTTQMDEILHIEN